MKTKLILIGAGPGSSDLITLRAAERIQKARVILYDALVSEQVLALAPSDVVKIFVGKRGGEPSFSQEKINQLIVSYGLIYGEVIRLKGGDPFIFGRGLEELFFAKKHGMEIEVVPGISSSTGLPALNQISLTHRGISDGFWVLTASLEDNVFNREIELAAQTNSTVVVLMGVGKINQIAETYLQAGRSKTPVLVIQNGSLVNEKIWATDIRSLVARAHDERLAAPAILVIGDVVALHEELERVEPALAYLN